MTGQQGFEEVNGPALQRLREHSVIGVCTGPHHNVPGLEIKAEGPVMLGETADVRSQHINQHRPFPSWASLCPQGSASVQGLLERDGCHSAGWPPADEDRDLKQSGFRVNICASVVRLRWLQCAWSWACINPTVHPCNTVNLVGNLLYFNWSIKQYWVTHIVKSFNSMKPGFMDKSPQKTDWKSGTHNQTNWYVLSKLHE